MNVSTSLSMYFDKDYIMPVQQQMRLVYDAGFRHMDMNFWDWGKPDSASPFIGRDWEKWVDGIGNEAARLGVRFTQSHAVVFNFLRCDDEEKKAHYREMLRRSIVGSAMLGIPFTVIHPCHGEDWETVSQQQAIARNVEIFSPYAELAAQMNIGLAMENMITRRGVAPSARQLCEFVDAFRSEHVAACWGTGHGHLAGQMQNDSLRTLGKRLKCLHIADNYGVTDDHNPPFFGTICWDGFGDTLREIGYTGDFTYEAGKFVRLKPVSCQSEAARLMYRIALEVSGAEV